MASLPSASQLYRRFTALVQRWPADPSKGPDRDLRPALERTVEQMFPRSIVPPTAAKSDATESPVPADRMFGIRVDERYAVDRLRALQELLENRHLRRFPPTQKTGFWGIPVEKVREMNTPKGRLECGVSASHPTGIWQQLWDIVRFRR